MVLIDVYTRKAVNNITYDALVKHVSVITDIRELGDAHSGCDFVFFESAVPAIVTPEVLGEIISLYSVTPHFVYNIDEIGELFTGLAATIKANYTTIEWNLVYAVIHRDLAILEPYQRTKQEPLEFASILEGIPPEHVEPVNHMYHSYISLARNFNRCLERNAHLEETVGNYKSVGAKTTKAIEELKVLLAEAHEKNRVYSAMVSESYDVTFTGMYPDRPRVLYIKNISHLSGIDNLLMVLYSVLTKQYKVSCKIVKLVDSADAASLRYVPNVYFPLTDSYDTRDVLTNDFLLSLGAYNMLMALLMLNRSALDILIVHDSRGTMNDALDPALVDLKLNEVSADYAVLREYENILSDCTGASFLWRFEDVMQYTGTNTVKLANHPTIGKIMDFLL